MHMFNWQQFLYCVLVSVFSLNVVCTLSTIITSSSQFQLQMNTVFYNTNSIRKGKFHPRTGQEGPEVE
jgi:hypothetical protein